MGFGIWALSVISFNLLHIRINMGDFFFKSQFLGSTPYQLNQNLHDTDGELKGYRKKFFVFQ